ncbi:UNVERIFIED_CONTAM: hypothetical protein NCL1_26094 [Trichonephila clavipes]
MTIISDKVTFSCNRWYHKKSRLSESIGTDHRSDNRTPNANRTLSKSGSQSVYLRHVDLNSAGVYRCEVSAEAPEFQTVEAEKEMKVLGKGFRITFSVDLSDDVVDYIYKNF